MTEIPPPYMSEARCNDLAMAELFFPSTGRAHAKQRRDAKTVCNGHVGQTPCVVRVSCGLWAIAQNVDDGIWGGMTPRERRQFCKRTTAGSMASRRTGCR